MRSWDETKWAQSYNKLQSGGSASDTGGHRRVSEMEIISYTNSLNMISILSREWWESGWNEHTLFGGEEVEMDAE